MAIRVKGNHKANVAIMRSEKTRQLVDDAAADLAARFGPYRALYGKTTKIRSRAYIVPHGRKGELDAAANGMVKHAAAAGLKIGASSDDTA